MKNTVGIGLAAVLGIILVSTALAEIPEIIYKEHSIAYSQSGRFCGWPANNGIYIWGNEIVVGFELAYYIEDGGLHHNDESRPACRAQLRSLDGGQTWAPDPGGPCVPGNFSDDPLMDPPAINYGHPDFGYTSHGSDFHITYDRAKNWIPGSGQGAYAMAYPPAFFNDTGLWCRPRHLVNGPLDCMFFCSAMENNTSGYDRTYLARTTDGHHINFVSWIGPGDGSRSVMPDFARVSPTKIVCSLRRKHPGNWIDAYVTNDNGASWQFLSKIVQFVDNENGNPPAMVGLRDGRIVCAYGYRSSPYGIRAKVSYDEGTTWSDEIHLRDDALGPDIGYCQIVQRPDGKMVTLYYYRTAANPENFIGCTIWELERVTTQDLNADGVTNFLDYAELVQEQDM